MKKGQSAVKQAPLKRWSVDKALKETIDEIEKGCSMPFVKGARKALDRHFRGHYEEQQDKLSWKKVRRKILILARIVGHLASTIELLKAHADGKSMPKKVGRKALLQAALLIGGAKVCQAGGLCPPDQGGGGGGVAVSKVSTGALRQLLHGLAADDL